MALAARKHVPTSDTSFLANARRIAALAASKKASRIVAFDVRGLTLIADAFVICTASSEPQVKAVANAVKDGMKEIGVAPLCLEGTFQGGWLLLDYGEILFHVFRPEAREFYDLDGMWGDAPAIDLDLESEA